MTEIAEALPPPKARELYEMMRGAHDYYPNDQREQRGDFTYTAKFSSSAINVLHDFRAYFQMLKPRLEESFGPISTKDTTILAYRMDVNDHLARHRDSHLGRGFVLYLSPEWEWDWGGLLVVEEPNGPRAYKPEFNKAVLMDSPQTYHYVTKIEPRAKMPRYAMVGFLQ